MTSTVDLEPTSHYIAPTMILYEFTQLEQQLENLISAYQQLQSQQTDMKNAVARLESENRTLKTKNQEALDKIQKMLSRLKVI